MQRELEINEKGVFSDVSPEWIHITVERRENGLKRVTARLTDAHIAMRKTARDDASG